MRGSMDSVPVMLAEYARRRERIVDGLRAIPGVTCKTPAARSTRSRTFPRISPPRCRTTRPSPSCCSKASTSRSFPAKRLARLAILRLSYATSIERIDEGLHRLSRFFGQEVVIRNFSMSRATGTRLQSAPMGIAFARAVFPGKSGLAEPIGEAWMTGR